MNYHKLFSFGSNMNQKQMLERCPSSIFVSTYMLYGYKLVFNRFSKMRKGGVASIIKTNNLNDYVFGTIHLVSSDDLIRLDRKEGLGAGYSRKYLKDQEMWYYCVTKNDDIHICPTKEYLNLIIEGLEENLCNDEQYINKIKNTTCLI